MNIFIEKFKNNILAVTPIVAIVIILGNTIVTIQSALIIKFLIGAALIVLGLSFFLVGVDIGIMPLGSHTGSALAKSNKLWIVVIGGIILGFFISIAEPDLMILANQVDVVTMGQISGMSIIVFVSAGFAVILSL